MTDTPEAVLTQALTDCRNLDGDLVTTDKNTAQYQRDMLRAAGYAIVPREPTEAMLNRGAQFTGMGMGGTIVGARDDARDIYRAMLAAFGDEDDS